MLLEQKIKELEKENQQLRNELQKYKVKAVEKEIENTKHPFFNQVKSFFEKAPFFTAIISCPDFRYEMVNQSHTRLVGGYVVGLNVQDVIHEDFKNQYVGIFQHVCGTGETFNSHEIKIRFKVNGIITNEIVMDLVFHPIKAGDGNVNKIFIHGIDLTEKYSIREKYKEAQLIAEQRAKEFERSNDILNALLEHIPEGIIITEGIDKPVIISRMVKEWSGRKLREGMLFGDDEYLEAWSLFHKDTKKPIKIGELPISRVLASEGYVYNDVWMQQSPDGKERFLSANAGPIIDKDGKVAGCIVAWRDITEQRILNQQRIRQKNLLEQVLNEIPVSVALHEGPEFITKIANRAYYDFAYGRGDILGRKVADVWPDIADQVIPLLNNVYDKGELFHAKDMEFTMNRGKGLEKAWFTFTYMPFRAENGKVTGILAWFMENTDYMLTRKEIEKAREELEHKTAQLEATIRSIPDGYILYDNNGNIRQMNEIAKEIIGFSAEEKNLPYDRRMALLKIETSGGNSFPLEKLPSKRAQGGETTRNTIMKITRANREYWLSVSASPILTPDGNKHGVVMEFTDISESKRADQELLQAHELLNTITHGTDDMIAAEDKYFNYLYFNEAYFREFKKLWKQEINKGANMVSAMASWPEERQKAKDLWSRALEIFPAWRASAENDQELSKLLD